MSNPSLRKVLEPIRIRGVEVKNRVVRTAHGTYLSTTPYIGGGDDILHYHLARAKGGVGLSIFEAGEVHASSVHGGSLRDDRIVGEYQRIMKHIRPTGMRMLQQLWHAGHLSNAEGKAPAWCVSDMPGPLGNVPVEMTIENIEELIAAYATAARRCREGGLDGVEFHNAHGYTPHQFLSPLINRRTDEYGGSLENRMRFTREALRAIRKAVGEDFIVGIRIGASRVPGSVEEQEARTVIAALEAEGLIDYLNATWGDYYRLDTLIGGMQQPTGYMLHSSSQLTEVARVPRIVVGRFRTLEEADQVIRDGVADMVSMVRAHIADPDLVRKTMEGKVEQVRPCIACNQGCQGGIWRDGRLGCAVNPAAGFEATMAEELIQPASEPKHILVVGGGPAGMEAARVARLRGHRVTLAEATSSLGGAINFARRAPAAHMLGDIAYWLESEVYRLGVEVNLNTYVEAAEVEDYGADAVIVATGSQPRMDGMQFAVPNAPAAGVDQPHVLSSVDLMSGQHGPLGTTALVLDTVGHFEAISVADHLIEKGLAVTFVTTLNGFGGRYVETTLRDVPSLERLYRGDFELLIRHRLVSIERGLATISPLEANKPRTVPADTVVLVTQNKASNDLYHALRQRVWALHVIGDALAPGDLQAAIANGHRTARAL